MHTARSILFAGLMSTLVAGCSPRPRASAVAGPEENRLANTAIVRLDSRLDSIIAPNTPIEKVASGFVFAEGPMWREGRLWFSDLAGNKMYAVTPAGKVQLLIDKSGGLPDPPPGSFTGSNAMVTDKDGSVLMLQHGARRIVRLDSQLHISPFLERFNGRRFNSPNDLVFAPDGALWFTDPPFGLAAQDRDPAKELPFNGVFRYKGGHLTALIRDLPKPNGIGFSSDGKTLYVSNSGPRMFVMKYQVAPDGTVSHGTKLIEYPDAPAPDVPDGLKLDTAGNIWTSGPGGFRIITPDGTVLGQIKLPEVAANLAWADAGNTAYITASTGIYRLKVTAPGKMPLYQR